MPNLCKKKERNYIQNQESKKAAARASYSADPKKKKASCNATPEKERVASRSSYRADPEEKRAVSWIASRASCLPPHVPLFKVYL